jgi:RNA polymerase sigma-70 factor (ECF subfamily)
MNELSFDAKALIERARTADGPSPERRARVKRALVASFLGASATPSAGSQVAAAGLPAVVAAKSSLTAGTVALWLGMGAALGTAASAPAVIVRMTQGAPASAAAPRAPERAPEANVPEARALPTSASQPEAPPEPPAPAVNDKSARPTSTPVETPAPAPSLSGETRLLEAAQRELASGRAASALSLLEEHRQRFPSGALTEERTAARVLSLCALGRVEEARRSAEAFVAASPRSPLIPRLRGSCAMDGAADDKMPAR